MAATRRTFPLRCAHTIDIGHGGEIGLNGFVPHPQREEDMRAHVLGVTGVGCDPRVDSRRAQAERGVRRVIVTVNQLMNESRVFLMVYPRFLQHARGPHIGWDVAARVSCAESRERVKGRCINILRISLVELRHSGFIAEVAL